MDSDEARSGSAAGWTHLLAGDAAPAAAVSFAVDPRPALRRTHTSPASGSTTDELRQLAAQRQGPWHPATGGGEGRRATTSNSSPASGG